MKKDNEMLLKYSDDDMENFRLIASELTKAGYNVMWGGGLSITRVLLTLAELEAKRIKCIHSNGIFTDFTD